MPTYHENFDRSCHLWLQVLGRGVPHVAAKALHVAEEELARLKAELASSNQLLQVKQARKKAWDERRGLVNGEV